MPEASTSPVSSPRSLTQAPTRVTTAKFVSSIGAFHATACVSLSAAELTEPEEVQGKLTVDFKRGASFRFDIFADENDEEGECVTVLSSDQCESGSTPVMWHSEGSAADLPPPFPLEAFIEQEESEGIDMTPMRAAIQTFQLFDLTEALLRAKHARLVSEVPPDQGGTGTSTQADDDNNNSLRFVTEEDNGVWYMYHVAAFGNGVPYAIDQYQAEDCLRNGKDSKLQLTLEDSDVASPITARLFVPPRFEEALQIEGSSHAEVALKEAEDKAGGEGEGDGEATKSAEPEKPLLGCGKLAGDVDMDDELARPYDEFWSEFLTPKVI
mmetsp:Transcript_22640/g.27333  ORF Transcript_22640/g.27333 Transcript_22640/m.27333 type:complete len:325 (+) Transcript_22640:158-1132(+)|eukprot:CAMPEP_0197845340 /NCGR_PEP_ID=MMETSP1438-20131217/2287_1 /TAXON_ID=1461541 /ORGANISM="Pterosperma sp., Strain CCMP1384" /LENGTH=324 /DNA_ID=CAMNT_0043456599 /DNA_START=143 /DNA_END=1117 /DNA_ORIENTATION=-